MIYVASSKFLDPQFGHHNVKLIETIQIIARSIYLEIYISTSIYYIKFRIHSFRKGSVHCAVYRKQMLTSMLVAIESHLKSVARTR